MPFVRRKTGIWHKHRRIAASEGALLALMSLYAPFIQPGHTHSAQIMPFLVEHHAPRTVPGLRETATEIRMSREMVLILAQNGRRDTSEPRDGADTKNEAKTRASDVELAIRAEGASPTTRCKVSNVSFTIKRTA